MAKTEKNDMLTLSRIVLLDYASESVLSDDVLCEECVAMLDVDGSGDLTPFDARIFLLWYAHYNAYGNYEDEAWAFLDAYYDGEIIIAPVATPSDESDRATSESQAQYNGIDVSRHQGTIDWAAVAADGVEFAMIRAGYGMYASNEPNFVTNMEGAKANGIACGTYWYCTATNATDAVAQANKFLETIAGYQFEYPVCLDIEDSTQMGSSLSNSTRDAIISAFCGVLEDAGYYAIVYSSKSYLENQFSYDVLKNYDCWVAQWNYSPSSGTTYSRTSYGMWQYSDKGTVAGITENVVDLDIAYKDYETIMRSNGLNGY